MPFFDKTGPSGLGSLTGRGLGPCGRSLGWSRGFGRGLGRYFGWNAPATKEEQRQSLADYRKALEEELEDVRQEEIKLK